MSHVETLTGKIVKVNRQLDEAKVRADETQSRLSTLIIDDAPTADLNRAQADQIAAARDCGNLERALEEAERRLGEARIQEGQDRVQGNQTKLEKLARKRTKFLTEQEAVFHKFLDLALAAEAVAAEILLVGGAATGLRNELNATFGRFGAWLVTRLSEAFENPKIDEAISAAISNHEAARRQLNGKSLADMDGDFTELYRLHHAPKPKVVVDNSEPTEDQDGKAA